MTLTPKVKVIGKKAGICDGVLSTAALVQCISQHLSILKTISVQGIHILFSFLFFQMNDVWNLSG